MRWSIAGQQNDRSGCTAAKRQGCLKSTGAAAIRDAFVAEHGLSTIHKSLYRTDLNAMDTLPKTLYDAFVQLHAKMTDDYSLCELITKEEHERRTRERMCESLM